MTVFEKAEYYVIVGGIRYDHKNHVYGTNNYDCPACSAVAGLRPHPHTETGESR